MTSPFTSVRGRVTLTVLAVTACLYSLLGTIGFLQVAGSGRDAIRDRIGAVVDQLELSLRSGAATVSIVTPDGVEATATAPDSPGLPASEGELRVERRVTIGTTPVLLVGRASQAPLGNSLQSLFRALWIGIPVAAVISALLAGLATRRALRPVAAITDLADSIGANDSDARVPVPDTGDEVEHLATTVNAMLARIAGGRRAQRQFSSDAAHELRTPLMALQGELELVHGHPDRVNGQLVDRLDDLARRLGDRVDDLVLLSTLDEHRPLTLRAVSLLALVREEATALPDAVAVGGDDGSVVFDPALMGRAVRNLLANACRHATDAVRATVAVEDGRAWLHVDDDGTGVAVEERERIFQRFARLDEARDCRSGGAGLGLSIVASVAAAHGGGVEVVTGPLGGARFSLWIPAAERARSGRGGRAGSDRVGQDARP